MIFFITDTASEEKPIMITDKEVSLTTEELNKHIVNYQTTNNQDSLNIVLESCLKLLQHIAIKYTNVKTLTISERFSENLEVFHTIIKEYDITSNAKFTTYLTTCLKNRMYAIIQHEQYKERYRLQEALTPIKLELHGQLVEATIEDLVQDNINIEEEYENKVVEETYRKLLNQALETLTERERLIIETVFGLNNYREHTHKEVAQYLKCSKSNIYQIKNRAITKMRMYVHRNKEYQQYNKEEELVWQLNQ